MIGAVNKGLERHYATPLLIGCFLFFFITGGEILDPQYIDWLMSGDPAQHWLGWQFFRQSPLLQWPLGANPGYGQELGSSIVFTDSIPIMALLFKCLNFMLPQSFQYFGIWLLMCFCLQAVFSWKLLSLVTDNKFLLSIGACLFCMAPASMWRLYGHYALVGQWVLIAALYYYFSPRLYFGRIFVLVLITVSIHAYLMAMTLTIVMAEVLKRRINGELDTFSAVRSIFYLLSGSVVVMWVLGYFMLGASVALGGFGYLRMNLTSPFNSDGLWSETLKAIPGLPGDYEGFNFLGLGLIVLMCVSLFVWSFQRPRFSIKLSSLPVVCACLGLTIYALSNQVIFSTHEIFAFPWPWPLTKLSDTFRASGRFFWPVYYCFYFFTFAIIFSRFKARTSLYLCAAVLVFQIYDTTAIRSYFFEKFTAVTPYVSPMQASLWSSLAKTHHKIVVVLPSQEIKDWLPISQFAATHSMTTNAVYLARVGVDALAKSRVEISSRVANGDYESGTIYIFQDDTMWADATENLPPDVIAGTVDGFRVLIPEASRCESCVFSELTTVAESKLPIFTSGQISFKTNGPGINYLRAGWSAPGDDGTWSVGDVAKVRLPMPDIRDRKLALRVVAHGFIAAEHTYQDIDVQVNGIPAGRFRYDVGYRSGPVEIKLPSEVLANGKPISVAFILRNAVSPKSLGVSNDERVLGIGLESIDIISVH